MKNTLWKLNIVSMTMITDSLFIKNNVRICGVHDATSTDLVGSRRDRIQCFCHLMRWTNASLYALKCSFGLKTAAINSTPILGRFVSTRLSKLVSLLEVDE